jgi:hypothetical protein
MEVEEVELRLVLSDARSDGLMLLLSPFIPPMDTFQMESGESSMLKEERALLLRDE